MLAVAAAAVVVVGGAIAAATLLTDSGGNPGSSAGSEGTSSGSYVASGPWRLNVHDGISSPDTDTGCTITMTDAHSGQQLPLPTSVYGTREFQIHQTGSFRWKVNNRGCLVWGLAGSGTAKLPDTFALGGDTDAFAASSPRVTVQVKDYNGSGDCLITLQDPANGQVIDSKTATRGSDNDTVVLATEGHPTAFLSDLACKVEVSAAP
jgi:hypothetical protein